MDAPPTFPFTDDELDKAGLLGEGVSESAAQIIDTMRKHPDLLKLSLFALQCVNRHGKQKESPSLPPALSNQSLSSNLSPPTFASEPTVVSEHAPNQYERTSYYNGVTGDSDHRELVYRSDFHTTPFPEPTGRYAHIPVKSIHGVFDTPLNRVWDTVGPQICDLIKARRIHWSSIDLARFFTHGPPGEEKGSLGPVVIWIGVTPGSTAPDIAHDVSEEILELLLKNGVEGVVVEWREAESSHRL